MHDLIAASADTSAWSFGGSILTFAAPMILFIVVAGALYLAYTKPEIVPGHRARAAERPVSYTPAPVPPSTETERAVADGLAGMGPKADFPPPPHGLADSPASVGVPLAGRADPPREQEPEGGE
ncbi:MAG: hypothetical protein JO037_23655 [Actinobacteria bacterium]|nr:hypothetical protein [Actinomycetota bacterium]